MSCILFHGMRHPAELAEAEVNNFLTHLGESSSAALRASDYQSSLAVMSERVSATEAARRFSDLLNRVRYGRETFVVVRGGEDVAEISPVASRRVTLQELVEKLHRVGLPDPGFADDVAEIQASQPPIGEAPWPS